MSARLLSPPSHRKRYLVNIQRTSKVYVHKKRNSQGAAPSSRERVGAQPLQKQKTKKQRGSLCVPTRACRPSSVTAARADTGVLNSEVCAGQTAAADDAAARTASIPLLSKNSTSFPPFRAVSTWYSHERAQPNSARCCCCCCCCRRSELLIRT